MTWLPSAGIVFLALTVGLVLFALVRENKILDRDLNRLRDRIADAQRATAMAVGDLGELRVRVERQGLRLQELTFELKVLREQAAFERLDESVRRRSTEPVEGREVAL